MNATETVSAPISGASIALGTIATYFTLANVNTLLGTICGLFTAILLGWKLVAKIKSTTSKRRSDRRLYRKLLKAYEEKERILTKDRGDGDGKIHRRD